MPNDSDDNDKGTPKPLKQWVSGARHRGAKFFSGYRWKRFATRVRAKLPKKGNLQNASEYTPWIQAGIVIFAIYLLAEVTTRIIGLAIRPEYPQTTKKMAPAPSGPLAENFDSVLQRNMFNVEGKIPDPGQNDLDCFSQARPTNQKINLLGTIVMVDERLSVALIADDSGNSHIAVKKDDVFGDGKYQAQKVDRKKLCFQVKATQELEFIEIPDDTAAFGATGPSYGGAYSEGIVATSETGFDIKKDFLEKQLLDLNNILQTARAVPYIEPGTGKFKGFLVQSIDSNSPFLSLGVKQGDVLSVVNGLTLDNPGAAIQAFQTFRNTTTLNLKVLRGGQEVTLNYSVK